MPVEEQAASCPLPEKLEWASGHLEKTWAKTRVWCDLMLSASEKYEHDVFYLAALIWWESGGDPKAYSSSGAVGLMQVMPRDGLAAEFLCINGPCFSSRPTIEQLENPEFNVEFGSKMLSRFINDTGSLREALMRYGPENVGYRYADKIIDLYERLKAQ